MVVVVVVLSCRGSRVVVVVVVVCLDLGAIVFHFVAMTDHCESLVGDGDNTIVLSLALVLSLPNESMSNTSVLGWFIVVDFFLFV